MAHFVIGTRGSALALWQARHVAGRLREAFPGDRFEERIIRTEGDANTSQRIDQGSSRGVFVREIERELLHGSIDLAVHSLKDLPTSQPDGLDIAAVPPRHDPRDALLSLEGWTLDEIPESALVATGSYRRRCQLKHRRPDLRVVPVRGNVDTRVRKLRDRKFDVLVLALAGLQRLGIDTVPIVPLDRASCLPAVGQGALAIETRRQDPARDRAGRLDDPHSRACVTAERSFLGELDGGCLAPATAHAVVDGDRMSVAGCVGDVDGTVLLRDEVAGPSNEAGRLGVDLAAKMRARGADELLAEARTAVEDHAPL